MIFKVYPIAFKFAATLMGLRRAVLAMIPFFLVSTSAIARHDKYAYGFDLIHESLIETISLDSRSIEEFAHSHLQDLLMANHTQDDVTRITVKHVFLSEKTSVHQNVSLSECMTPEFTPGNLSVGKYTPVVFICEDASFKVMVKFVHESKVLIAKESLKKGDTVSRSQVSEQWKILDLSSNQDRIHELNEIAGLVPKHSLSQGQVLSKNAFEGRLLIKKGDEVPLRLIIQDIVISGKGKALNSGQIGDHIDVIYAKTKKTLKAKVLGDASVEILSKTL